MLNKVAIMWRLLSNDRFLVRRLQTKFIIEAIEVKEYGQVVDVGAGKSPYRKFIRAKNYLMLDVEDRLGTGEVVIGDLNSTIPLADDSVDLVCCIEVLEHLKDPQNGLKEISRILKPDGKLVLTTPMLWPEHEVPNDYFRYTQYGLSHLLSNTDLRIYKLKASNGYFYTMCQLVVLRLKHPIWRPFILMVNSIGLLAYALEKDRSLPLGVQLIAIKESHA